MPKYLITQDSFIDNYFVKAGSEIETEATPGTHWQPLDKKAEVECKLVTEINEEHTKAIAKEVAAVDAAQAVLNRVGVPLPQ